jgi:tetratricopeptide (TPR) repeat protein
MEQAIALHQRGELARASAACQEVLRAAPGHFDAEHLLGVIAAQTGRPAEAISRIGNALAANPYNRAAPIANANLGRAYRQLGQRDQALRAFSAAIALDAGYAEAHYHLGTVLAEGGDWQAAAVSFERAIRCRNDFAEACFHLGNAQKQLGRLRESVASYDRAIKIRGNYPEALCNRGYVLGDLGQWEAALASYDQAIAHRRDFAVAHLNRGNALRELRRWEEALASYDRAIALRPDYVEAHSNRGAILRELNQREAAVASYDHAIALDPARAAIHFNRGNVLQEMRSIDAALASYERALELSPDHAEARFNRSLVLLLRGDYECGWREYEWRHRVQRIRNVSAGARFAEAPWLGERSLSGLTILLHCEQGLGDTLQFCRYTSRVAALGARVVLEVQAPLRTLLTGLDGVSQLIVQGESLPEFDEHCPLMSLPLALGTTLDAVPANVPYLAGVPEGGEVWRERLGPRRKLRVGLVWSGGFRAQRPELWAVNARRNIPLATLAPLALPDIEFFSLQKGEPAEAELDDVMARGWKGPSIVGFSQHITDFADTAGLLEQLDLLISVDTSTAHLAGALGRPVWILNRYDGCWRWLLEGDSSPWYPSARLYRQKSPGDWDEVIARVRSDLCALLIAQRSDSNARDRSLP